MSPATALAVACAGLAAGTINTIVGSGSLITFPALLAAGLPPVLANVSNTVGMAPGSLSGAVAYRRELAGQRRRVGVLVAAATGGGLLGGGLLLWLPGSVFVRVVPALVLVATLLIVAQPALTRWLAGRGERHPHGGPPLVVAVFATAVYGGYFGAAQGVILIALLAVFVDDDLQRLNAVKNVLALVANAVAAVLFVAVTHVSWEGAGLVAAGSVVGAQIGARVARRLPPVAMRAVIVVVGTVVAGVLIARYW